MAIIQSGEDNLQQSVSPEVHSDTDEVTTQFQSGGSASRQQVNQPLGGIATPTIVNQTVPVVVFVGPASSGKSMILVRLAKYLHNNGYTIKTDPTFLNTDQYFTDCVEFESRLNDNVALPGTVKFLLVSIYNRNGEEVAKLLEAPGEDFFTTDPANIRAGKNKMIEPYLAAIMTSNNPKYYVTLLDLDSFTSFRRNGQYRADYEDRFLRYLYPAVNKNRDRIILLYNKIDMTPFGDINGCNNLKGALNDAKRYYPALFASLKVTKIGGFLQVDNFAFKTFCTGMFSDQTDNNGRPYQTYNIASDTYPRDLWREITSKW